MTLRAGLSGCGAAGRAALTSAMRQRACDIVALHDERPELATRLASEFGIGHASSSFAALLAYGVDFVVLCGPLAGREAQVVAAAEQGVPCLLHAPMALDLPAAEAMVAACARAEVRLGVAFADVGEPLVEDLRRFVADGWLGGLVAVQALAGQHVQPDPTDVEPAATGALWQLAADHLHLQSFLLGRPALHVTAQSTRGMLPAGEDGAVATALLRGGALATFAATRLATARELVVLGGDGAFGLSGDRVWMRGNRPIRGRLLAYEQPGEARSWIRPALVTLSAPFAERAEPHGRFARWLDDEDDFPCTGEQALADLRLFAAAARAAHSGRTETP